MAKSKLTEQDKKEIRELHAAGVPLAAIKAKFNISHNTIYRVLDPKKYEAHLRATVQYQQSIGPRRYRQNKEVSRRYTFSVNKERDPQVIAHLDSRPNINEYIRSLVIADIENEDN